MISLTEVLPLDEIIGPGTDAQAAMAPVEEHISLFEIFGYYYAMMDAIRGAHGPAAADLSQIGPVIFGVGLLAGWRARGSSGA